MPQFVVWIQQAIDVEADSEQFAKEFVLSDPPMIDCAGYGISRGGYAIKSRSKVKIMKVYQRKSRKYQKE